MRIRHLVGLVLAFLPAAIPSSSQKPVTSHPPSGADASKYPDTKAGLQKFLNDIIDAAKANDSQKVAASLKSTEIPNCDKWLHTMYDSDKADSWMGLCDRRTLDANEQTLITRFTGLANADGEFIVRKVNDDPEPGRGLEWGWLQAIRRAPRYLLRQLETCGDPRKRTHRLLYVR